MRRTFVMLPIVSVAGFALFATGPGQTAKAATVAMHVSPSGLGGARSGGASHGSTAGQESPQSRSNPPTEWVSNTAPIGNNTSCTQPKYNTISAALTGSPAGATVNVCAGTYGEELAITKAVTLTAVGSVTVQGPSFNPAPPDATSCDADGGSQHNQDVVDICHAGTVSISGFTIKGGWPSNVCYDSINDVAVLGSSTLNLSNSTVSNTGGDPQSDGCQGGVGVQVGLSLTSPNNADPGTATLTNVTVNTYQKNGITIDGTGSSATLSSVTVTGTGPTTAIAQNGIQVSDGAKATISQALVTGDECNDTSGGCGPDGLNNVQSAGILLFDADKTTVSSSTVKKSDIGIYNVEDFNNAPFFTPPSPFTAVNEAFSGMTLLNRYENVVFDAGQTSVNGSTLQGAEVGVLGIQYNGQGTPVVGVANGDAFGAATIDAVQVRSDGHVGDKHVTLTTTNDTIGTSNVGGVSNSTTIARATVNATKDWWGNATGPSVWSFGSGSSVSADVDFFPWATNSNRTTFQACSQTGTNLIATGNNAVLCASSGNSNAFLENNGAGSVLLLGNNGNDQLVGSSVGETWVIARNPGANVINGRNGMGFIEERNNPNDTLVNTSGYTVAPN